ncbi:helix-turn-helix domain-containing protein [Acuticoccus sediminis]|uniref:helix-turn-helix domain-containing protein n=1 Tax=Acuticoccus sediminis TaxID=2184697 RepID=UPI001CFF0BBE|nr:helix-turn-helix transcriptional regulator [Acuticoccus sediminis]
MDETSHPVGALLKDWRQRRRLSQLALASDADVSQRHLSFVETGRSAPSRSMVLRLAERLDIPLRERNALLLAAGYAPSYRQSSLEAADSGAIRTQIQSILDGHSPNPALAVDRYWTLIASNRVLAALLGDADPALAVPPVNVLRLTLGPGAIADRIANYREWRAHILHRLARDVERSADPALGNLLTELRGYAPPPGARPYRANAGAEARALAVPLELAMPRGVLRLISTTTVFGTATDVTLSEIVLECFYPIDEAGAAILNDLAAGP